jgi:hypothetical protein
MPAEARSCSGSDSAADSGAQADLGIATVQHVHFAPAAASLRGMGDDLLTVCQFSSVSQHLRLQI